MPHLILIRGVPGAGKTTFAEALMSSFNFRAYEEYEEIYADGREWHHFENDMFMVDSKGVYKWEQHRVLECVAKCEFLTKKMLERGDNVIVSNTFTKRGDYKWYIDLAKKNGYRLTVLTVEGSHGSIHDIPKDKMDYFEKCMRNPFQF